MTARCFVESVCLRDARRRVEVRESHASPVWLIFLKITECTASQFAGLSPIGFALLATNDNISPAFQPCDSGWLGYRSFTPFDGAVWATKPHRFVDFNSRSV